ncbi:MAG: peptidoglycan DD-metalloendopeptidase family protein [Bacteroidia bacterium]|jgi:septal ring factor EnvC (AmiA/AmiB activator)|nr:peptidoglycan DD-metalloendopeptidase family protein [Bacteroidia bacterium]
MKKLILNKWLVVLVLLIVVVASAQQNANIASQRKVLEQQRKELLKKIQDTKKVLQETKNKQEKTLSDLKVISKQIENREKVINTVGDEIAILEKQITDQQQVITTLRDDMTRLKLDYGKSILGAYKQRNVYDKVLFIFSASSFNQAIKRIQYLNQLGDYRKHQADLILHTQKQITGILNELIAHKQEKQGLIVLKEAEKVELEEDKKEESAVLIKLQDKEKELKRALAENERAARKLNDAIADLIRKEIAEARRKEDERRKSKSNNNPAAPRATPTDKKTTPGELYLTPEAQKLSDDFENNIGKLPWPVERGVIAQKFGMQSHPTLKGVVVNNNGIDIQAQPGAPVRTVFKGVVRSIFSIPGMGKIVLINHGKYYTAYAKLASVNVKEGQEVSTREQIGTVMTSDENETEVHFEIWKVQTKQNPEVWLKQ